MLRSSTQLLIFCYLLCAVHFTFIIFPYLIFVHACHIVLVPSFLCIARLLAFTLHFHHHVICRTTQYGLSSVSVCCWLSTFVATARDPSTTPQTASRQRSVHSLKPISKSSCDTPAAPSPPLDRDWCCIYSHLLQLLRNCCGLSTTSPTPVAISSCKRKDVRVREGYH
jgi:hypothetical protein